MDGQNKGRMMKETEEQMDGQNKKEEINGWMDRRMDKRMN